VYGSISIMSSSLASQVDPKNPSALTGMKGTLPNTPDEMFAKRLGEAKPGLRNLNYAAQAYDATIITTLAAAIAHTDAPHAIAKAINGVTKDGEECDSFARCMILVKDGRNIAYVGASGPMEFSDSGEPRSGTYVIVEIQSDGTMMNLRKENVGPVR